MTSRVGRLSAHTAALILRSYIIRGFAALVLGCLCTFGAAAQQQTNAVDVVFSELLKAYGSSQGNIDDLLEKLKSLEPTFTPDQNERYQLAIAHSLGDRGKNEERVTLVEAFIGEVKTPARRARFLYELVDGYAALGKYEQALQAMNASFLLLPTIEKSSLKIVILNGAMNLLNSLRAFDEAMDFAERIYALGRDDVGSYAACAGLAGKVETGYMSGNSALARTFVPNAIDACDANKNLFFTLIVKALAAIDLINSGDNVKGLAMSLPVLRDFAALNPESDYVTQLEEAVARAYLKTGNLERAEHFGVRAYARAQLNRLLAMQEKTSATMAAIKRAQGQPVAAMGYYDINLALKDRLLDDRSQKSLAFQRVKFDAQDKANQMALLEQKNKTLNTEKALQHKQYQNLVLLLALGGVLLSVLGGWLYFTLRSKNIFRASAQVDGLTQVSNRAHFTASAHEAFKNTNRVVSLILFDMDLFKRINDTYGHATGDWVLKTVCDTAKAQLPDTGLLGRLGGEEFAMCLPNYSQEDACALAELCRAAVAAIDTTPRGIHAPITASFGVATRIASLSNSFEETLVQADKALYLSKNEGRNRVSVFQQPRPD